MKDLKKLSREEMRHVLGGVASPPQCGSPSDSGGCSTAACTASSGDCKGKPGTCGGTSSCMCAAVC